MDAEITIIGAGVVGLAIAEKVTEDQSSVFLIEKHLSFGQETSSRNSEVIHAGIYYPEGSLKSKLCVEGKALLYDFCRKYDIPFNNCGKIIVATSENEIPVLSEVISAARRNGVSDLRLIDASDVREMEPAVFALKAVWSPSTGIIDSHSFMKQLETNIVNNGGNIVYGTEVKWIRRISNGYEITLKDADSNDYSFTSSTVINSAGLTSDKISEMTGINDEDLRIRFCKGEYFRLKPPKNRMISRLIYPVPLHNLEGIGIHVTIDMGGGVKLGPDVTWLQSNNYDYTVDKSKQDAFFSSARKFLPFLEQDDIYPEMAGIRPKIQKPGEPVRDFYIMEEGNRGLPGFINLIGIESPGLTSCLAIGEYVRSLIN
ncbi:MAG: NAD(P)/FAD-dependent oxidoreductase [Bacteroidales bacterium]|jgi:L-2-hydroxyglutarate oxidase LhgO